ncbi:hypothetical protein CGGC5_v017213 [Colletotrichum fructicola Nara gc5]|uniref:Ankyrin repeat protein n=2 Tax=Colletotrichum fructicola (strain Nara gc5) TaxID=1213859 RepID=A0A7J6IEX7_COLFN|nr:hypothetical protein CGGC5_v017213 [Colletotrichum fructicola Nara gc5]
MQQQSHQASGTLLHLAAYSGFLNVVSFLLSKGTDVDISLECSECGGKEFRFGKVTSFYLAAYQEHHGVVQHLRARAEIGWSTYWPIHRQLPEVLEAMISRETYSADSKDGLWSAFEYVSSAWYDGRRKVERDEEVKKGQLELIEVAIQHRAYDVIDGKDQMEFVNHGLGALDCSAALALVQAGQSWRALWVRDNHSFAITASLLGLLCPVYDIRRRRIPPMIRTG